ncbi:MAG TPA: iron-containing alcohol dehydrogenase, partial [Candidatus Synoicihabitans sp.]|nr:iron-containing alcohol dehydrogenase [Candidatus Synoicihabitans sp.]
MSDLLRPITLLQPPRVVFGAGCAATCATDLAARGMKRVAFVATTRALTSARPLLDALASHQIEIFPVTAIPPEPTVHAFDRARAALR